MRREVFLLLTNPRRCYIVNERKGGTRMALNLIPFMIEKVGIILIIVFLLSQMKLFRQIIQTDPNVKEKVLLIILFGCFGLISNYTGIEIYQNTISNTGILLEIAPDNAIANTRVLGAVIGGLLGGPAVGLGAGLIAGIHRYSFGGFTAFACSIAVVLAGVIAGYLGRRQLKKENGITVTFAVKLGMALEAVQMMIILLLAKPFDQALHLVKVISIPMIFINGLGMFLFMVIIQSILRDQNRARANQTTHVFHIAEETLPHFKQGLTEQSCKEIAEIMLELTEADAVSITNSERVLAHVGAGSDHHIPKGEVTTRLTKKVLEKGQIEVARSKENIYCSHQNCPLEAAIVLPLKVRYQTMGTLKMYFIHPHTLDAVQQQLAEGLANLFSTQLELAEVERQAKLLKDAEIRALHTQIHPHFLFNSLNSISALCRTDATKARELILELSLFFRGNLQGARKMLIPLEQELENVQAYLSLEHARFPNKYDIQFLVDSDLGRVLIPPFILQPLVENAINYGFAGTKEKGVITIEIVRKDLSIMISVSDNGRGINSDLLHILGRQTIQSTSGAGTSIYNIRKRLEGIYNGSSSFSISSLEGEGTKIILSIPLNINGGEVAYAESVYS